MPLDAIANIHAHLNYFTFQDASQQYKTLTNRILTEDYDYDPAGNLMSGQSENGVPQQYRYDAAGRLVEVWNGGGTALLESHAYGATNARLMTVQGGTTTYYGWDGGQVVAEYTAAGTNSLNWNKSYVYLSGRSLATQKVGLPAADTTQFHHPDRLGTRLVTNGADGAIVSEQVGQPYGTMLANGAMHGEGSYQDPNGNRANQSQKRFTSYDRSATTGLDYAVNRFYSSAQGRFTQVDPIGMEASSLDDPQTLNLYSYCGNDPINRLDPDGLFWGKLFGWIGSAFKWIGIAVAVTVAVLTLIPTVWAGVALGKILAFSLAHPVLSSVVGLGNSLGFLTPGINGTGVSGVNNFLGGGDGAKQSWWDSPATVGAVSSFIRSLGAAAQGGQESRDLREVREMEKNPDCYVSRKRCEVQCSGEFFKGAANTATAIGAVLWGAGQPILPKDVRLGNSSAATSPASRFFKFLFPDAKLPGRWPAPTARAPLAQTTRVSTFLGRLTPIAGGYIAGGGILLGGSLKRSTCVEACMKAEGKCK